MTDDLERSASGGGVGSALARGCADTVSVLRRARPVSALRWLSRLAVDLRPVVRTRSLRVADEAWRRRGATFRTPSGRSIQLPGDLTAGAREMYCRDVYLKTGLAISPDSWVVDLGANAGLFTVLAAVEGARVVAVEAQRGFQPEIARLLELNNIEPGRVHVEIAMAVPADRDVALVGVLADDERWRTASHAAPKRPAGIGMPQLMTRHSIDRIGLLKMDIEGSEFSLLHPDGDLSWLDRVDQIAMEVHPLFGDLKQVRDTMIRHGFAIHITDNDGHPVPASSKRANYAYCHRPSGQR